MLRPELLAPAGSFDALRAACYAGADAVYLGGQSFNARASAANFDNELLSRAIIFAHRSNVKVYVTVNTLLKDSELEPALEFLGEIYNMGADAVIIQDLGLLKLAAEHVPKLERHASTQTTTTSLEGAVALKELGASRVVLARELSAREVKEIAAAHILPVEIFVHGALCVAYSGQCLMSSIIGGRSGNRGQCAQPCRLPYAGSSRYPLSPRDLCLIDHIPELLTLGASSWKIEGRLKRPEYVAEVVGTYRKALERALVAGEYAVSEEERYRLLQAFNRRFTTGYLHTQPRGELYSGDRPDNRGVAVGTVLKVSAPFFVVCFNTAVAAGDVCDLGAPESSFTLPRGARPSEEVELKNDNATTILPGATVYRLIDAVRNKEISQAVELFEPHLVPVEFEVSGMIGEPMYLRACAHGKCVEVISESPLEASRSIDNSRGIIERQLQKLGGSGFAPGALRVSLGQNTFVAISEINSCRRQAIEALTEKLWGQSEKIPAPKPETRSFPPQQTKLPLLGVSVADLDEAKAAESGGADYIVVGQEWLRQPPRLAWQQFEAIWHNSSSEVILRWPRIMHSAEELEWRLLSPAGVPIMAASPGALHLAQSFSQRVYADTGLNVLNNASVSALLGLRAVALSHELNRSEVAELSRRVQADLEVVVHGRQLLMVHANCIYSPECSGKASCRHKGVLVDRKGAEFHVATDYMCRSYVLNSQVLSLIDATSVLARAGIARLRVEAAGTGAELVYKTVSLYRQALTLRGDRERLEILRSRLAQDWGILTRGHWQRGV